MTEPIIDIQNLGKKYNIGHRQHYYALRDVIMDVLSFKKTQTTEEFWALKEVSFTVNKGDVIGIIGKNGSGKSTLLKVLSQITPPTSGKIEMRGRVASLLEVGTGFNPELTGSENIYLNGAILGMTRKEINQKYDEIVGFSGVEKFLDTPVKRYSSGMYVRLAFAVAAHLEPEILLIDEVLAVGDAEFQNKCLGKMDDVSKSGRTILFVSHNMGAVQQLCKKSICLADGKIVSQGDTLDVIKYYTNQKAVIGSVDLTEAKSGRTGNGPTKLLGVSTKDIDGNEKASFNAQEPIVIEMDINAEKETNLEVILMISDESGNVVIQLENVIDNASIKTTEGNQTLKITLPNNYLNNGNYSITTWLGAQPRILHDRIADCLTFSIDNSQIHGFRKYKGIMHLPAVWK